MRGSAFNPLLLILVGLVRAYRWGVSPFIIPSCRFAPSCSEYAMIAFAKYGFIRGSAKTAVRLVRCQPLHPGGVDLP